MCGIVGYVGRRRAVDFLLEGLRRLEYRGYDSAGLATVDHQARLATRRAVGRIDELAAQLAEQPLPGRIGIGHTRWATHGPATVENAHPHLGGAGSVAVVHNGVIENYRQLRERLQSLGCRFRSATDSEVVAHLVEQQLLPLHGASAPPPYLEAACTEPPSDERPQARTAEEPGEQYAHLLAAVQATVAQLRGTYGLVFLFRDYPEVLIAARLGSPLVLGVGHGEHFIASDASPLVGHTEKIVYLADHQLAIVTAEELRVSHRETGAIDHSVEPLALETGSVELGRFPHYMLKEIFEQPESLENTMRGRFNEADATAVFGGLNLSPREAGRVERILLTGCGTSWHAALVGEYLIEQFARIPVEVEYASELRYRNPPLTPGTLLFAITQSGETADTLAALKEMKRKGVPALAICNVVGSTIAQEADGGIYLHAGPEIGVASTKAFTSQCLTLAMLALHFGRLRHLSYEAGKSMIAAIRGLPAKVEQALAANDAIRGIAGRYCHAENFLYLGRQFNFPTALEGALKLKEISYIHAEGYPAAEMKHGPIALVDEQTPSVFLLPRGFVFEKVMANLEEIKARGGPVIAIVEEGDQAEVAELADETITIPQTEEFLQPIVASIPLQLLAYHIAVLRGCDVDKPRNLAKSVTVE